MLNMLRVAQVCNSILKLFPNGLYRHETAEKKYGYPSIMNYFKFKGGTSQL